MSAISKIEWCDRTWNPVRGCSIVSPGCHSCYAMKQAHRFSGPGRAYEGLTKGTSAGPQWTGKIRTVESALLEPLSWRKPQRVFVNSMSDLFHEGVEGDFIARVFATMAVARQHTFQILTKRPERMQRLLSSEAFRSEVANFVEFLFIEDPEPHPALRWDPNARRTDDARAISPDIEGDDWPLPNVWLGVSCEDQQRADERIPLLLQTPAAIRFISAEPLLGPIDLLRIPREGCHHDYLTGEKQSSSEKTHTPGLDWTIVGGESGPKARPCDVGWIRSIVQQCQSASVPVFVKQLGHMPYVGDGGPADLPNLKWGGRTDISFYELDADKGKGGDPAEWPEDLRVRQFPDTSEVPA